MTRTRRGESGKTSPINRPASIATFNADAGANKYSTPRPSIVAATHPPILAVGDAVQPTTIAVTQIAYLMAFESGSHVFTPFGQPGSEGTIGSLGYYDSMAVVGNGIPPVWRDDNMALQPAFTYSSGIFSMNNAAPLFTANIEIGAVLSVNVADSELEIQLRDINNTPPNDVVASTGTIRVRNINSPTQLNAKLRVDIRGGFSRIRILPGVQYAIHIRRIDAGADSTITIAKYRQEIVSVGVA